jgi:1-hydroxycarotenoid 3,4-desaturase
MLWRLAQSGLHLTAAEDPVVTGPAQFHALFPGTGGALYGPATHGTQASFRRPGSRTKLPGLYLAGGSAHPGAGVPMAALSGRLAAASVLEDLISARKSRTVVTRGGTSMR